MKETGAVASDLQRRQYERLEKNLTVRYCRLEKFGETGPDSVGELVDIGGGGLCFLSGVAIELGVQLVVKLEFPGWLAAGEHWIATKNEDDVGTLYVIGMVVWVAVSRRYPEKYDIGLQFSGIVRQ